MSITYPLAFPSGIVGPSDMTITPNNVVGVSASPFTGEQQVYQHQGQFWSMQFTVGPYNRADGETFAAWLTSLMGRYGTFLLGDPQGATPRGAATGTPLVNGASQTGNALITDGWTAGVTGILKAGDYIQLGSGTSTRLHKVLQDVNSNGSGQATLDIWPRLRTSPADNAAITVTSTKGHWRLATNNPSWSLRDVRFLPITLQCVEAF